MVVNVDKEKTKKYLQGVVDTTIRGVNNVAGLDGNPDKETRVMKFVNFMSEPENKKQINIGGEVLRMALGSSGSAFGAGVNSLIEGAQKFDYSGIRKNGKMTRENAGEIAQMLTSAGGKQAILVALKKITGNNQIAGLLAELVSGTIHNYSRHVVEFIGFETPEMNKASEAAETPETESKAAETESKSTETPETKQRSEEEIKEEARKELLAEQKAQQDKVTGLEEKNQSMQAKLDEVKAELQGQTTKVDEDEVGSVADKEPEMEVNSALDEKKQEKAEEVKKKLAMHEAYEAKADNAKEESIEDKARKAVRDDLPEGLVFKNTDSNHISNGEGHEAKIINILDGKKSELGKTGGISA